MMEDILFQYGAIGACLVFFMSFFIYYNKNMQKVIENNTIAMTKVYEIINLCPRTNRKV